MSELAAAGRVTAYGNQLVAVHMWLRDELARLRDDVDAYLDGAGDRPSNLRTHCLAFCSAVTRHHTGEDGGAFPALATQFPELRPTIDELVRDHDMVAGILRELGQLLDGLTEQPDEAEADRVRAELDGLTALLESHFRYEEKRIVTALNTLDAATWTGPTPDFLLTT
jgi:hemerythrin-like domain-containing protein